MSTNKKVPRNECVKNMGCALEVSLFCWKSLQCQENKLIHKFVADFWQTALPVLTTLIQRLMIRIISLKEKVCWK